MVRLIGILAIIAVSGFILYGLNSGDISTETGVGAGVLLLACLVVIFYATRRAR